MTLVISYKVILSLSALSDCSGNKGLRNTSRNVVVLSQISIKPDLQFPNTLECFNSSKGKLERVSQGCLLRHLSCAF